MRRLVLLLALLAALPCAALEIEAGHQHEKLTNSYDDWKDTFVNVEHTFSPRQTVYGWLRETERFRLDDTEMGLGLYQPLGATLTGQLEVTGSPDHNVLARNSVLGQLYWEVSRGWVATGGWRHSEYTSDGVNLLIGGLEHYWGNWRAGYTIYNGRPEGAGSATSHRFAFDYYYGDRSRIGLSFTAGREVENQPPPTGLITSQVRAVAVTGRHWFAPAWAVTWEAGTHDQDTLYRRTGFRLGLRYRF